MELLPPQNGLYPQGNKTSSNNNNHNFNQDIHHNNHLQAHSRRGAQHRHRNKLHLQQLHLDKPLRHLHLEIPPNIIKLTDLLKWRTKC